MCGIFGFKSSTTHGLAAKAILKNMGDSIYHRGPDDDGYFCHRDTAIGMRRLSIIDLKTGTQPIYSNNKNLVIVYNGEVYNYKELRSSLEKKGYHFNTTTDTEVIVNLYQEKGPACLNKLNGMFAFAIYDIKKGEMFIGRDRFGIKPLYYAFENNKFIFGSELKSILEYPGLSPSISNESIDLYLTFEHVPAPYSIYENIFKLEQGHYLVISDKGLVNRKWYSLSFTPKFESVNPVDYIEELDELINKSVSRRLISDVPIGAFLSGGIDSSLIAHYLKRNSTKNVQTFSIGFEDKSFDESSYARQVANYLGTDHHEKIFSSSDLSSMIPSIIANMDEPFGDASLLPTTLLSKYTRENVTVALSGDGSDEIFGGYPTYYARKLASVIPQWSYPLLRFGASCLPVNDGNISFDFKAKKLTEGLGYDPDIRHQIWLGSFNSSQKDALYNNDYRDKLKARSPVDKIISDHMKQCNTENNWERSLWMDMRYYLQDNMLVKVDRASMMNSLEVRVPFLDHTVVDFALKIPAKLKYRGKTSKYILKQLAQKHIPRNIINRPKKGFGIPIAKWIKNDLKKDMYEVLLGGDLHVDYFKTDKIQKLLKEHIENKKDNRKLLWTLFILNSWLNK